MSRRHKYALAAVFAVSAGLLYGWWEITTWRSNVRCHIRLRRGVFVNAYTTEGFVQTADIRSLTPDPRAVECPASGTVYVYQPFTGPVRPPSQEGDALARRMIAWCPTPCHKGCRNVLLEDGTVIHMSEEAFKAASEAGFVVQRRPES